MTQQNASNEDRSEGSIVVIGDKYLINSFRLIGIHAVEAVDDEAAANQAERIAPQKDCRLIIITEKVAKKLKSFRDGLLKTRRTYPLFLIIPDFEGSAHERTHELHELVNETIGVKLKTGD